MAEVFGVVASAIALLHLSAKGARILQSVPGIESDFKELCEEIENIDNWVKHAQATISSIAAGPIKTQIAQTAGRLEDIARGLERIEGRLKKDMDDGTFKVKRTRWLLKADMIAKLLQKARSAKQDLSFAIQWQQKATIDHLSSAMSQHFIRNEQTTQAILGQFVVLADKLPPSDLQTKEPQRVEELPDSWREEDEREEGEKEKHVSHENTDHGDRTTTHKPVSRVQTAMTSAALLQPLVPSCPEDCRCGCHAGPKRRRNEGLVGSLLGYLGVHYDLPSRDARQDNRCMCSEQTWRVEYRPPPWLEARVWLLSWSFGTAGPVCSLRAARVFPCNHIVWTRLEQPVQAMRYAITKGDMVYPDDRDEIGLEVIESIIAWRSYDILELLLMKWESILRKREFSRHAAWAANAEIEIQGDKLDEWQRRLLQRVVNNAETSDEPATSKVHQAAKQDYGMVKALQADGWARDVLDSGGMAPLHWAASRGHVEAVQHLIGAGADIDVKDSFEWTPLMVATRGSNTDCARQLLHSGCRTDLCGREGRTALHLAAHYGLIDIVWMLLSAEEAHMPTMAATARPLTGHLPLHELAWSSKEGATAEAIEETARLLLDAYPDAMEARDEAGWTPVIHAVCHDNLPFLRCLVQAGASLTVSDAHQENILHHIACLCSAPTIDFFLQEDDARNQLPMVDHQLRNKWGNNPWDQFVFCIYAPPWEHATTGHAGVKIQSAFADLYCRIRDRNLCHDIPVVHDILVALQGGHINTAHEYLYNIASCKADGGNNEAAAWYRGFAKQIDAGEIEDATAGIEEDLQDLQGELQSSPWDQYSRWDYLASKSQWFEVSDTSLWIEPAAALVPRDLRRGPDVEEHRDGPQSDHAQDETDSIPSVLCVDHNLLSRVYSDRGYLLYDRETASCSPREFFESYERGCDDQDTEEDSQSRASSENKDTARPAEQDTASCLAKSSAQDAEQGDKIQVSVPNGFTTTPNGG